MAVSVAVTLIVAGGVGTITGCFSLSDLTAEPDPRTASDIDGDGIPNETDDDLDGDGLPNDRDPDADSDGRFDRPMIIDFPFDHNALIQPLLPPNHPDIDYSGRVVMPNGHIDVTDIIRVNLDDHPLEVFEPRRQDEIAAGAIAAPTE
jgi:hypothetical protein